MVTGYAALQEGVITPNTTISCEGEYRENVVRGKGPKCWTKNPSSHSNQTVVEGLKNSCNYFFYYVATRLGIDDLNKWADMFGLSSKTNVDADGGSYQPMWPIKRCCMTTPRISTADS